MNNTQLPSSDLQGATDGGLPVTFALFAYNQEKYIREAIEGAFAQTYAPLEIILSDDGSTDRTFEIMREMAEAYRGPHAIKLNKNAGNLGLVGHVNRIFELAEGELIVAAAGDDISLPARTERLVAAYQISPSPPLLIHSSVVKVDEHNDELGVWVPPVISEKMDLKRMAGSAMAGIYIGASGAWSKKLYQYFGPLKYERAYEDLVFGFRAALDDSMVYVDEPLVKYRVSTGVTAKLVGFNGGVQDVVKRLRHRRRLNFAHGDVFRQRIDDLSRFTGRIDENIPKALENALFNELTKESLYRTPLKTLLDAAIGSRGTRIGAVVAELKFMADLGTGFARFHLKKSIKKFLR